MTNRWGKNGSSDRFYSLDSKITADGDYSHEIKRCLLLGRKAMTNLDKVLKKQGSHLTDKGLYSQSYGFSSSHVWMWELDHKEGRVLKNWCFWTVVLEKTLESSLDSKEIKPVNPKGNQPCILTGKDPDAEKDWGQEEKGWQRMRWLDGITETRWFDEFEQTGG